MRTLQTDEANIFPLWLRSFATNAMYNFTVRIQDG